MKPYFKQENRRKVNEVEGVPSDEDEEEKQKDDFDDDEFKWDEEEYLDD